MASFDVESLTETTHIITNNITAKSLSQFGLEKKKLNYLLNIVTKDSVFTFDEWVPPLALAMLMFFCVIMKRTRYITTLVNLNFCFTKDALTIFFSCSTIHHRYNCNTRYVESTTRWFKHRFFKHMGLPLTNPAFSAIRQHSHTEDHPYTHNDFKILSTSPNSLDLHLVQILKMKPELNHNHTATQLFTV